MGRHTDPFNKHTNKDGPEFYSTAPTAPPFPNGIHRVLLTIPELKEIIQKLG